MLIFALAYWGRNFSFAFWENLKQQNNLSKLTDLYTLEVLKDQQIKLSHNDYNSKFPGY